MLGGDGLHDRHEQLVGAMPEEVGRHLAADEGGNDALVHPEHAGDLPLLRVTLETYVAYPMADMLPEVDEEAVVLEAVGVEL